MYFLQHDSLGRDNLGHAAPAAASARKLILSMASPVGKQRSIIRHRRYANERARAWAAILFEIIILFKLRRPNSNNNVVVVVVVATRNGCAR